MVRGPTHSSWRSAKPSWEVGRVVEDAIAFTFQTYIMLVDGKVCCRKKSHALGQENGATSTTMSQERFVDTCMSKRRKSACSVGDKLATVCASSCFHTSRTGCSSAHPRDAVCVRSIPHAPYAAAFWSPLGVRPPCKRPAAIVVCLPRSRAGARAFPDRYECPVCSRPLQHGNGALYEPEATGTQDSLGSVSPISPFT